MADPQCHWNIPSLSENLIIAQPRVLKFKCALFCIANGRKKKKKPNQAGTSQQKTPQMWFSTGKVKSEGNCMGKKKKKKLASQVVVVAEDRKWERRAGWRTQQLIRCGLWSTTCSFTTACLSSAVSRQLRAVSRGSGVERTKRTLEASCQPRVWRWR